MVSLWWVHLALRNAGIVDLGWVAGFVILETFYLFTFAHFDVKQILLFCMVGLWAGRLFFNLLIRFLRDKREDPRYEEIRRAWGTGLGLKFFLFFQFQGLLDVFLSLPFFLVCRDPRGTLIWSDALGFALWLVGIFGEAIADNQLREFKTNPAHRGRVCEVGMWNYSRHPNYFFEWLIWVGFFVFAASSPWGWLSILSPLVILFLLLKVSGIPPAETQSLRSKGDVYREYQRTTSVFIPWFKGAIKQR